MFGKKKNLVSAVIPAAGSASRMGGIDKNFYELGGVPIIVRTLLKFERHPSVTEIVIPTRADMIDELRTICDEHNITKVKAIVAGGATRAESVLCGLRAVSKKCDIVAIHDAARPMVSEKIISDTINAAIKFSAAAPAIPIVDTVKRKKEGFTDETVDRDTLCAIQTPQVFDRELILGALSNAVEKKLPITDDCSAVELIGGRIALCDGDVLNRKITTREDLIFARVILENEEKL